MEYLFGLVWLALWPIVIYVMYKISIKNVLKFEER
jgi:hypothetical protein